MTTKFGHQLRACGRNKLPLQININNQDYNLAKVFKHDFFAATALYVNHIESSPSNENDAIVLKISRCGDFLGIPLAWLGQWLCQHEVAVLRKIQREKDVPVLLDTYRQTGFLYRYIPGTSLDEKPQLPHDYFERLEGLLKRIHARRVAYIDMNKRGNILLGEDNLPKMIDFQISCHIPPRILGSTKLADTILQILHREDLYHLQKHRYRFSPDPLERKHYRQTRRISPWIAWHRRLTRPLTRLRRNILGYLFRTNQLISDDLSQKNPETDPNRWNR